MKDAIGVIGGMGPLASQLFYKMITEHTAAECDQDHVPLLILSDVTMPREFQEGVLRIEFYEQDAVEKATALLSKYSYIIHTR